MNDELKPWYIGIQVGFVKKASCGKRFFIILNTAGDLFTCGSNKFGQLGFDYPNL